MLRILFFIMMFVIASVQAGEIEKAFQDSQNVFVYFYTDRCKYCVEFSPIYEKLSKKYSDKYAFVKLNSESPDGYRYFKQFGGRYVPYVVLYKKGVKYPQEISPSCLLNINCVESYLK